MPQVAILQFAAHPPECVAPLKKSSMTGIRVLTLCCRPPMPMPILAGTYAMLRKAEAEKAAEMAASKSS